MPDIVHKYGNDGTLSVNLHPSKSSNDEEALAFLKKANYVTFKKDALDASIAFAFELIALNKKG